MIGRRLGAQAPFGRAMKHAQTKSRPERCNSLIQDSPFRVRRGACRPLHFWSTGIHFNSFSDKRYALLHFRIWVGPAGRLVGCEAGWRDSESESRRCPRTACSARWCAFSDKLRPNDLRDSMTTVDQRLEVGTTCSHCRPAGSWVV